MPSWLKSAQQNSPFGFSKPNVEERLREFLALYCGEVKLIDDSVGRLITCLEQQGILDDTIIVFTADHGEYAGEHGLHGKNHLYETAYRVPMLIRWPEKIASGTVIKHIVSTVDFQPSILNLMGISPCGREQGRDVSPLMRGEGMEWQNEAFIHHSSLERAGIFTDDFELAYVKDAEPILFNRRNDPDQVNNLFGDPNYKQAVAELTGRIIEHHIEVESPAIEWLKQIP